MGKNSPRHCGPQAASQGHSAHNHSRDPDLRRGITTHGPSQTKLSTRPHRDVKTAQTSGKTAGDRRDPGSTTG
jgi:hypothetical protein